MTQLAATQQTGIKKISSYLNSESIKSKFTEVLGKQSSSFLSSLLAAISQNDMLKDATTESIYTAALTAATLNLPINSNLGFAYIVPYRDKSGIILAQFQMGYKGFKQLAIRSGQFRNLDAKPVYEGQLIENNSFLGFEFDWSKKTSDKIVGYASNFVLASGFESTFYMTIESIEKHAKKYSQTYKKGYGLWKDDFDKMALKTVSKLHLNSGEAPLSIEMQRAIANDQAVIDENLNPKYVDNQHEEIKIDKEFERISLMLSDCKTIADVDLLAAANPEINIELINGRKAELI